MSHAFMPMYWGDYLRDTAHLTTEQHGAYLLLIAHCWQHGAIPASDAERAAVAKLAPSRWRSIGGTVAAFFNADGTHKRVSAELEKTERISLKRKIAGSKGGHRAAITRAVEVGKAIATGEANGRQHPSKRQASAIAGLQQTPKPGSSNHNHIDNSNTESCAENAVNNAETPQNQEKLDGSLATAPRTGALRSPSRTAPQPSSELSRLVAEKGWTGPQNSKETSC